MGVMRGGREGLMDGLRDWIGYVVQRRMGEECT